MLNEWVPAVLVYCYTMTRELCSFSNIHAVIVEPLQIIESNQTLFSALNLCYHLNSYPQN